MAADYWGNTIAVGDKVWVAATVGAISGNNLNLTYTNPDNTTAGVVGIAGQTVKQEGDQPPKPQV